MASSRRKSGFVLDVGFGRKLWLATFLGLYPTWLGEFVGEAGGLSIGGGLVIKGLSLMSIFMLVKSGSVADSSSFMS